VIGLFEEKKILNRFQPDTLRQQGSQHWKGNSFQPDTLRQQGSQHWKGNIYLTDFWI
jgi:hypothetical protein